MKKFLVIQLARFGDLLQTKRLIRSLQRQGEVHLCVDRSLSMLARSVYDAVPFSGSLSASQDSLTVSLEHLGEPLGVSLGESSETVAQAGSDVVVDGGCGTDAATDSGASSSTGLIQPSGLIQISGLSQTSGRASSSDTATDAGIAQSSDAGDQPPRQVVIHTIHAHGNRDAAAVFVQNKRAFARLREQGFDAVYNLNFSGLNFALSTLFDADSVRGYGMRNGQRMCDQWMRMAFRWTRDRRTSPLNLMDFWGLLAPEPIRPEEVNPIAMRKGGGIGVVLAGRMSRRSLPPEVLARCVQSVFEAHGGPEVRLLGTEAEAPLARQLMRHFGKPLLEKTEDLSGRTDFSALMEIVGSLDVVLTPDTGTMHLAAHLGTPVHAFFLSSAWVHETGPYGLGHRIWQGMMPCSPCLESQPCPIQTECLNGFSDDLFLRMLAGKIDDTYPQNMLGFVSMLDSVGVTYMPVFGEDPRTLERKDIRMLVAERFGLVGLGHLASNEHAMRLYHDADWILHHKQTEDI